MNPPIPSRPALFIDVDGTLVPIVGQPREVRPDVALLDQLGRLQLALDGALAILSGRTLADIDVVLAPLVLPAAGVHGAERRRADGMTVRAHLETRLLDDARAALREITRRHPRLRMEDKGLALAVHYRDAPDAFCELNATMSKLMVGLGNRYHVQPGVEVLELKPRQYDKGSALKAFMSEAVFRDRQPVVLGDDITDLDAFRAAEESGGMSVAVGERIDGQWRLADPPAVRQWLSGFV